VVSIWGISPIQLIAQDNMEFEFFTFSELIQKRDESGKSYFRFFDNEEWSAGLYYLGQGETDEQNPHQLDEVYYVIEGASKFVAGEDETFVRAGSIIFVKAQEKHRFYDITQDLQILVIFTKRNSADAPNNYFTGLMSAKEQILQTENISVDLSNEIRNSGFGLILKGSAMTAEGEDYKIYSPGVYYLNNHSEISWEKKDPVKILSVTSTK
jgi:mannose-6-phosphate isomerase-like protein (cupin superfamily)